MIPIASRYFRANPDRFHCVSNGIDLQKFTRLEKRAVTPPMILMLGTLNLNKGQAFGIRAFNMVLDIIPNAILRIVGDGADLASLEELAKVGGLESKVEFLGRREDVPDLMSAAHVFWQLSESEGLPMVVLEAMAAGLPVVGFDVRGTRDVVVHGETGYLVPFGDLHAVAQQTIRLLNDESAYQVLSLQARQRVERDFNLESMVDGHERVLCGVVEANRLHN